MAGLKIKDERVYVIYYNGLPLEGKGRKLVYTTKGAANGVITSEAEDIARERYEAADAGHNDWWYDLDRNGRNELIDKVRKEFEVVEYGPINKREG